MDKVLVVRTAFFFALFFASIHVVEEFFLLIFLLCKKSEADRSFFCRAKKKGCKKKGCKKKGCKKKGCKKKGCKKKGCKKKGEVESLKGLENAEERWLSGRKRLIANPLYELYSYRGFESLSLRNDLL